MKIDRFTYSGEGQLTAIAVDEDNYRVWLGIDNGSECKLLIKDVFNPENTIYEIDVEADKINEIAIGQYYVFLALDDDTNFAMRILKAIPSSNDYLSFPLGVNESPVRVKMGTYTTFLTPGVESDENPFVVRYNTDGTYQGKLELTEVGKTFENAMGLAEDSSNQLWVSCSNNPMYLIKVMADLLSLESNEII